MQMFPQQFPLFPYSFPQVMQQPQTFKIPQQFPDFNLPNYQERLQQNTLNNGFQYCPCKSQNFKKQNILLRTEIKCLNCENRVHPFCIGIKERDQFECPQCVLTKLDPLNKVIKQFGNSIMNGVQYDKMSVNFLLTTEEMNMISTKNYAIEVRCISLDFKIMHEITWPDFCELYINQTRVLDLKPLQANSSVKKRKDDKYTINDIALILSNVNSIILKEGFQNPGDMKQHKLNPDAIYLFGVFLVNKLTPEQLIQQIKEDKLKYKPKEESINLIRRQCTNQNDQDGELAISQVSVSLRCQFDMTMIRTPCRGRFCEHIQCFSLENIINMTSLVTPRKWKCPICKQRVFDLLIDQQQLEILEEYRSKQLNVKEVTFNSDGETIKEQCEQQSSVQSDDEAAEEHAQKIQELFIQLQQKNNNQEVIDLLEEDQQINQQIQQDQHQIQQQEEEQIYQKATMMSEEKIQSPKQQQNQNKNNNENQNQLNFQLPQVQQLSSQLQLQQQLQQYSQLLNNTTTQFSLPNILQQQQFPLQLGFSNINVNPLNQLNLFGNNPVLQQLMNNPLNQFNLTQLAQLSQYNQTLAQQQLNQTNTSNTQTTPQENKQSLIYRQMQQFIQQQRQNINLPKRQTDDSVAQQNRQNFDTPAISHSLQQMIAHSKIKIRDAVLKQKDTLQDDLKKLPQSVEPCPNTSSKISFKNWLREKEERHEPQQTSEDGQQPQQEEFSGIITAGTSLQGQSQNNKQKLLSKQREKLVKTVKRHFNEYIRKNFIGSDNPLTQQFQQSQFLSQKNTKATYKLSQIEIQHPPITSTNQLSQQLIGLIQNQNIDIDQLKRLTEKSIPQQSDPQQELQNIPLQQEQEQVQPMQQTSIHQDQQQSQEVNLGKGVYNPICIEDD